MDMCGKISISIGFKFATFSISDSQKESPTFLIMLQIFS